MALPHYRRGGAVNGRIGAVNDVALTSPEGDTAASAGELRHTWHPWLLSHSYRTRGSAEEPPALFLGLLLII